MANIQTTIQTLNNVIPLEFRMIKTDLEPGVDPIMAKIVETSEGVSQGISHQWQVVHTYTCGVAGAIKDVLPTAASTVDQDFTGQSTMWNTSTLSAFPGLDEETSPGYVQKTISLVEMMGVLSFPLELMAAEQLDATIVKPFMLKMEGAAKNALYGECASIYSIAAQKGSLVKVAIATGVTFGTSVPGGVSDGEAIFNFDVVGALNGRVGRLVPGQTLDMVLNGASAVYTFTGTPASSLIVKRVDYTAKKAYVGKRDGAAFIAQEKTDMATVGSFYIKRGTSVTAADTPVGVSGVLAYVKSSGNIGVSQVYNGYTAGGPGALSLSSYPQFKSLVAAANQVMDESLLNKYVGGFYDAYGDMYELDSIVTTTGVLTAHMEQIDGLYRYERNNKRLTLREGWSSMDYAWQGKTFEIAASRWMEPGNAWILKLNNNWMRYVPPSIPGTSRRSEFHRDIQFIAPKLGSANIWLPARAATTAAITKFATAPFIWLREYCPDQIPGIVLTGVGETNP